MSEPAAAALKVEDLRAGYGSLEVLHGISIEVRPGEAVAVLGPNGAGKSTLLRTISGLIAPTGGSVAFEGRPLAGLEAQAIPHLGLVQVPEARHVFPALTVTENLLVGGTPQRSHAARAETLAEVWRMFPALREKADAPAGALSGGQQQMLAIGRAVMARPRMIMLDEPSLGLAPLVVREMYEALRLLVAKGLTILLVEQDIYVALDFVHRAYVLENGVIALSGTAAALRENEYIRESYLGM